MNLEVTVHPYKYRYGAEHENPEQIRSSIHSLITNTLSIPQERLEKLDVYNLGGEKHNFNAGGMRRLIIYLYASFNDKAEEQKHDIQELVMDGAVVVQYSRSTNELNILADVVSVYSEEKKDKLKKILELIQSDIFEKERLRRSWLHSDEKDNLIKSFVERITERERRNLEGDKRRQERMETDIKMYQREIRNKYEEAIRLRKMVASVENGTRDISGKITNELDMIAGMEQVEDIHINRNIITLHTNDIYAYANHTNNRYHIGKLEIIMDMDNTDVRFKNKGNGRKSYWSETDPHPHVNGSNGEACLGNVASTIAELCAQKEMYALATVAIDFLENANQDDPAGENIINWDEVDEEGNVIREGGPEYTWNCEECGSDMTDDDDMHHAYQEIDENQDLASEVTICTECREEHYYYEEQYDELLHGSVDVPEVEA